MKEKITQLLNEVLKELQPKFIFLPGRTFDVVRPSDDKFGDYTTNVALVAYADFLHALDSHADEEIVAAQGNLDIKNPKTLAEKIKECIDAKEVTFLKSVEIAGPGHINFSLSDAVYTETLEHILREKERYGNSMLGAGEKVNNEFISANPTGPLHLGNGRGGFFGDTLGRVLLKAGYEVTNEYYINDAGEQIMKLGHSVLGSLEAVYGGEYIEELRRKVSSLYPKKEAWENLKAIADVGEDGQVYDVGKAAANVVLEEMIKPVVKDTMRVHFDQWTSEREIIADGYVDKALNLLKERGKTFEAEGALWLRTTEYGDDKDRVLAKSDGTRTYFASDCGHILWYMERGVTMILETFGADHHGYTRRFEAVARALGFTGVVHFTLVQLVRLMKDGKEVRMSKRAGNVVGIDELIERVGHDVTRFFFLMYSPDTHMNFDLGLAEEHSEKNPVYYVQYAYARLSGILTKAKESALGPKEGNLGQLTHLKEKMLIRELMAFPELIERAATERVAHQLPQYVIRLADRFHSFYADCRVIDEENHALSEARLALVTATRIVLGEALRLIGVTAPEKM